jgi:hypothetical protein
MFTTVVPSYPDYVKNGVVQNQARYAKKPQKLSYTARRNI